MFYICEETNGKYGIKNTNDNSIKHYTAEEVRELNKKSKVFGVLKNEKYAVRNIDEYQKLDWGEHYIFSFVDKDKKEITIGVEDKKTGKLSYSVCVDCYLDELQMKSFSEHKNGNLEWIFEEGTINKCVGVCIWLDYGYDEFSEPDPICLELYLVKTPDNKIEEAGFKDWNFDESGNGYTYDEETDSIIYV